jgi:hypothetical protein
MHGVRSFAPLFFIAIWLSLPAQAQVYRLADLNTEQIHALNPMKTAVIISGGILEEHGPYLPSYSDGFFAEAYSRELANAIVSGLGRADGPTDSSWGWRCQFAGRQGRISRQLYRAVIYLACRLHGFSFDAGGTGVPMDFRRLHA